MRGFSSCTVTGSPRIVGRLNARLAAFYALAPAHPFHRAPQTWDAVTGVRMIYLDGVLHPEFTTINEPGVAYVAASSRPRIFWAQACYPPDEYFTGGRLRSLLTCDLCETDIQMDDLAIFAGALSAEEVAARWNASLTDRLTLGLERNLVFFCARASLPCEVVVAFLSADTIALATDSPSACCAISHPCSAPRSLIPDVTQTTSIIPRITLTLSPTSELRDHNTTCCLAELR